MVESPLTLWRYRPTWRRCHESATAGSGRWGAPAWRRLSGPLWAHPLGRTAPSAAGHRRMPNRGPRGPYHAVRSLWPRGPGVQLVPPPLLAEMSWGGASRVARRPGGRGARHTLCPCDLYPAARSGASGVAAPLSSLWAVLSHRGADAPGHGRGLEAPRGGDGGLCGAAHVGPTTAPTSTFIIPGIVNLLILRKKRLLSGRIVPHYREFPGGLKMGHCLTNDLRFQICPLDLPRRPRRNLIPFEHTACNETFDGGRTYPTIPGRLLQREDFGIGARATATVNDIATPGRPHPVRGPAVAFARATPMFVQHPRDLLIAIAHRHLADQLDGVGRGLLRYAP